MPFSLPVYEEKPYNRCIDCIHIGVKCDGPDFLAMEIPRLCEWSRLRKDYLHRKDPKWTNAYISEKSGVSETTVGRFFSGKLEDLNFSTAARILRVLVNGTWGQYPCAMAAAAEQEYADNPAIVEQCKQLQDALEKQAAEHKADIATVRAEAQETISLLKGGVATRDALLAERYDLIKQRNKTVAWLSVLLGAAILVILGALIVDGLNPNIGFFWVK